MLFFETKGKLVRKKKYIFKRKDINNVVLKVIKYLFYALSLFTLLEFLLNVLNIINSTITINALLSNLNIHLTSSFISFIFYFRVFIF